MNIYTLKNETLTIQIASHGAELKSIKKGNTEYLWNADPKFWGRTSPVLFPVVGSFKDKQYEYDGKKYPMSQHGFARDKEFSLLSETEKEIWFRLKESEATLEIYPFHFNLDIGYKLEENTIQVMWRVTNTDTKTIYFSIGGHPAFMCPKNPDEKQTDCYIEFDRDASVIYGLLNDKGCYTSNRKKLELTENKALITEHLFDEDALIIEDYQASEVSLCGKDKKPYLTVSFDAPLFGIWSPAKKNAPFVCIEPWYGRCDADDFEGTLSEREYGHNLAEHKVFNAKYTIQII